MNKKILRILFCLQIGFCSQVYSKHLNNSQCVDSVFYPGLEEYLDVYFNFYYGYPQNLSELFSFINYYNNNRITSDSYCGLDLIDITIPKIEKNQDRLYTYSTDSCFSLWLDNDILILKITPHSGTPCKYLTLMKNGFYDIRSATYEENVLFFNDNMTPVIHGLEELVVLFYSLKMEVLEKYSERLMPFFFENGVARRQFYQYEKGIGLTYLCENHNGCLINPFYDEFSRKIEVFFNQYGLAKIVFCMGVYNLK